MQSIAKCQPPSRRPPAFALIRHRAGHASSLSRTLPLIGSRVSGPQPPCRCRSALASLAQGDHPEGPLDTQQEEGTVRKQHSNTGDAAFWEHMRQLMSEGSTVPVRVRSFNRGGLVVDLSPEALPTSAPQRCHGFIPFSKLYAPAHDPAAIEAMVGTQLSVRVFEVHEDEQRLLMRMRHWKEERQERLQASAEHFKALPFERGQHYDAVVHSIRRNGLDMDLGQGVLGFLHMSQMGRGSGTELSSSFKVGDAFQVMVVKKEQKRQRITLSTKTQEVFDASAFERGRVYDAVVQKIRPYGLFMDLLQQGAVGLLHISQISFERVKEVPQKFKVGDAFKVMIMQIDEEKQRITLSTKYLERAEGDMLRDRGLVAETAEEMAAEYRAKGIQMQEMGKRGVMHADRI